MRVSRFNYIYLAWSGLIRGGGCSLRFRILGFGFNVGENRCPCHGRSFCQSVETLFCSETKGEVAKRRQKPNLNPKVNLENPLNMSNTFEKPRLQKGKLGQTFHAPGHQPLFTHKILTVRSGHPRMRPEIGQAGRKSQTKARNSTTLPTLLHC